MLFSDNGSSSSQSGIIPSQNHWDDLHGGAVVRFWLDTQNRIRNRRSANRFHNTRNRDNISHVKCKTSKLFLGYRARDDTTMTYFGFITAFTLFVAFTFFHDMLQYPTTILTIPMMVCFCVNHLVAIIYLLKKFYCSYFCDEKDTMMPVPGTESGSYTSGSCNVGSNNNQNPGSSSKKTSDKKNHPKDRVVQENVLDNSSHSSSPSLKALQGGRVMIKRASDRRDNEVSTSRQDVEQLSASGSQPQSAVSKGKVYVSPPQKEADNQTIFTCGDDNQGCINNKGNVNNRQCGVNFHEMDRSVTKSGSGKHVPQIQHFKAHRVSWIDLTLENINFLTFVLAINMYLCYVAIVRFENGFVDPTLPGEESDALPDGLAALTMIAPIFLYMILRRVTFFNALLAMFSTLVCQLTLAGIYNLQTSFFRSIFAYIFLMFMLSEYHRQVWHSFQINHQLGKSMEETARMAEEIKASELRHMIGNVAHDLKTPLSSFLSGMDVIQREANELRSDLLNSTSGSISSEIVKEKLVTILEVADNVMNTNAFMVMTINRCIDYNKTLFGLKLAPKSELFLLKDSVSFIIQCLKNNFAQVVIVCEYVSEGLRGGDVMLRSDRQWLQENLLCLVGNAAKFSELSLPVVIKFQIVDALNDGVSHLEMIPNQESESLNVANDIETGRRNSHNSTIQLRSVAMGTPNQRHSIDMTHSTSSISLPTITNRIPSGPLVGKNLLIEVYDTGKGIPANKRRILFDEPVQNDRELGGSGLGLFSLAKRVESLGGTCGVSDREDEYQGSKFWFSIPFEAGSQQPQHNLNHHNLNDKSEQIAENPIDNQDSRGSDDDTSQISKAPVQPFCDPQDQINQVTREQIREENNRWLNRPLKIMLVDDSPAILKMTSLALRKLGHTVTTAENGQIAVNIYQKELTKCYNESPDEGELNDNQEQNVSLVPFDLILMDFQMPIMDGVEAILQIRKCEQEIIHGWGSTKITNTGIQERFVNPVAIIGFSAKSDEIQIEQAYQNGMNAFLPKPFTTIGFHSILQSLSL